MKKTTGFLGILVLVSLTGCATQDYVRSQVDPLVERLNKLETQVAQPVVIPEADKAAIRHANDNAQAALDLANKVAGDVMRAEAAVKGTEAAVKGAEAAAKGAEAAAKGTEAAAKGAEAAAKEAERSAKEAQQMKKKSEKIFELEQKK